MKRMTSTWLAILAIAGAVIPARGSMIGIGREGAFAIEIFAEGSEVVRGTGTASVPLPRDAEGLFFAADIRKGDGVWTGDGIKGSAPATVVLLKTGWRSCELKIAETVRPASVPVERFHLLRWTELGNRFVQRLDSLSRTNETAYLAGLGDVLSRARTVFGGQNMVEGFPGTQYATAFASLRRAFDRCARDGQMRGFSPGRPLKTGYRELFGAEWPVALPVAFLSGDSRPLEIRRVADASGRPLPDVFTSPLPIRLEGSNRVEGILPAGTVWQVAYALADDASSGVQVIPWDPSAEGNGDVLFMLQYEEPGAAAGLFTHVLENKSTIAIAARMDMGGLSRTCTVPAGGRVLLCRVANPGSPALELHVEPDPATAFARDWSVVPSKESDSLVRLDAVRKAAPELVLNNPEMMPVDVTVTPVGGGRSSPIKLSLKAGETRVGIPVPAHQTLAVGYRFRSDFHVPGHIDIPGLFHGDRSNLVLRAELKGTPAKGPVQVKAPPVVPQASPVGGAPRVSLRNNSTMDVEATLMSASGRPVTKPVSIKRGEVSPPMVLPIQSDLYFRLVYSKGRFTTQGRLPVPPVSRVETKTLDIPEPALSDLPRPPSSRAPISRSRAVDEPVVF